MEIARRSSLAVLWTMILSALSIYVMIMASLGLPKKALYNLAIKWSDIGLYQRKSLFPEARDYLGSWVEDMETGA
jgi:hypothetical protein